MAEDVLYNFEETLLELTKYANRRYETILIEELVKVKYDKV